MNEAKLNGMHTAVDKNYCMSSYLALRYVECDDKEFYPGLRHLRISLTDDAAKIPVGTADEIDAAITGQFNDYDGCRQGILLSGGMDSAVIASYLQKGNDAYTFRFLGSDLFAEEITRAEYYANQCGLVLHYVDIGWETVESTSCR